MTYISYYFIMVLSLLCGLTYVGGKNRVYKTIGTRESLKIRHVLKENAYLLLLKRKYHISNYRVVCQKETMIKCTISVQKKESDVENGYLNPFFNLCTT